MSTIVRVNNHLTVSVLVKKNDIVLCQNIKTGEYVTWIVLPYDRGYGNGHYTFDLTQAMLDFDNRVKRGY